MTADEFLDVLRRSGDDGFGPNPEPYIKVERQIEGGGYVVIDDTFSIDKIAAALAEIEAGKEKT